MTNLPTETTKALSTQPSKPSREVQRAVIKLFACFPSQTGGNEFAAARLDAYGQILADLDQNAVCRAINRFTTGELGDGRFAPTAAQIRQAVTDPCYGEHDLRFTPDDRLTNEQYWKKRTQLRVWGAA
jgi:hypothetical protein